MPEFIGTQINTPETFKSAFEEAVVRNYGAAWVVSGQTARGFIPIGLILAAPFSMVGNLAFIDHYVVGGAVWFPWCSKRNVIEGTVAFIKAVGKSHPLLFCATEKERRLYEVCLQHAVLRRIGTSFTVLKDQPVAVYESR